MAAMSDYLEEQLLRHVLRGEAFAAPAAVYAGLYAGPSADDGSATEIAGVTRQEVAFDAPVAGAGTCANSDDINWTGMPGGTVTAIGLFSAATGGELLFHGNLAAPKPTNAGDTLTIYAGALIVTLA